MKRIPIVFFFLVSMRMMAQDFVRPVNSDTVAYVFSQKISPDSIGKTLYMLASPELGGRETGKRGQRMAADSLVKIYTRYGLEPYGRTPVANDFDSSDYKQIHAFSLRYNKGRNLSVNGENFLFGKDFIYYAPPNDTSVFINKILFVASRVDLKTLVATDRYSTRNLLIFDSEDVVDRLIKLRYSDPPVSAVFVITSEESVSSLFMTAGRYNEKSFPSEEKPLPFPVFYISEEIARKLVNEKDYLKIKSKAERKKKRVFIEEASCELSVGMVHDISSIRGENVIVRLKGSDPSGESIVISSHYDHLGNDTAFFPGADDNGSGTSAVVELARVFTLAAKEGWRPKRNIVFLNVSGEEKGLFGSTWFVNHPPLPLDSIVSDLNMDMIGRTDSLHDSLGVRNYVHVIGANKLSTELDGIVTEQNRKYTHLELDYTYNDDNDPNRFYKRSDHYNFARKGIPVAFFFDGKHIDYHKPSDTPEKIDLQLLTKRAQLVFLTAWELANRDKRIVVDRK